MIPRNFATRPLFGGRCRRSAITIIEEVHRKIQNATSTSTFQRLMPTPAQGKSHRAMGLVWVMLGQLPIS